MILCEVQRLRSIFINSLWLNVCHSKSVLLECYISRLCNDFWTVDFLSQSSSAHSYFHLACPLRIINWKLTASVCASYVSGLIIVFKAFWEFSVCINYILMILFAVPFSKTRGQQCSSEVRLAVWLWSLPSLASLRWCTSLV